MFRVLLVDDEVLALNYLENLIVWKELGFVVAGKATSADKALSLAEIHKPHLVISDIRMPYRDGLYLCEKLIEKNSTIKILLLSAYADFSYAKKAFSYGVSNYILKHELSADSLTRELKKIARELKYAAETQRIFREKVLSDLLFGSGMNDETEKLLKSCKSLTILLLRKDRPFIYNDTMSISQNGAKSVQICLGKLNEQGEINYLADIAL